MDPHHDPGGPPDHDRGPGPDDHGPIDHGPPAHDLPAAHDAPGRIDDPVELPDVVDPVADVDPIDRDPDPVVDPRPGEHDIAHPPVDLEPAVDPADPLEPEPPRSHAAPDDGPAPSDDGPAADDPPTEGSDAPEPALSSPQDAVDDRFDPVELDDGHGEIDLDGHESSGRADLTDDDVSSPDDTGVDLDGVDLVPGEVPTATDVDGFRPLADNGWMTSALLVTALGAATAAVIVPNRGGRLGARHAVAALERNGVEARVEYGDVTALGRWVAAGDHVIVSLHPAGREPQVCSIVAVDDERGEVVLEEPGPLGMRLDVDLASFGHAWADTANEVLVTERGGRCVRLLPVTLDDRSVRSPGW